MQKLKVNDEVQIIAGKDKGSKGKILSFSKDKKRIVVEKCNIAKKHVKPGVQKDYPDGGIREIEMPLAISNVMLVCPQEKVPTRIGIEVRDGKKVRVSKKSNVVIEG